ncbi:hypothetical protein FRC04_004683 [Tulasnella sp. 424]|nr:hypothetical protein FRC04_004683 [Tulasnella sp. 424]
MYLPPWAATWVEPSVTPLSLSLSRKSQRRAVTTASTIPEEDEDVPHQTRSPLPVHVPEPDIEFDGTDPYKCCDLIRDVWTYAWKMGKHTDKRWIAEFAATRLTRGVIAWYSRLSVEVKYDWDKLHHELIEAWGPNSANPSLFISDQWGGLTRSPNVRKSSLSGTPSIAFQSSSPAPSTQYTIASPAPSAQYTNASKVTVSLPSASQTRESWLLRNVRFTHSAQPAQSGRLVIKGFTKGTQYIGSTLNLSGICKCTSEEREALLIKVDPQSGRLDLEVSDDNR